ncbi:MAG: sulfite exporter TauE/SafE family protein [Mariprofundaceae bacterium]|nr:sulfite exporter TauE/SafE family protein [Mariprofundaceae bacterium]
MIAISMAEAGLQSLLLMLGMGFIGSLHCIGMCGGLVAALSLSRPAIWWRGLIVYQAGRVATYAVLGLLAGLGGMGLVEISGAWLQRALAVIAGLAMLFFALNLGGWLPDPLARITATANQRLGLAKLVRNAAQHARSRGWLLLGMANGLLPCGLVYAALTMAVASADVSDAFLMMIFFGLGTVPAMLLAPLILDKISIESRARLLKFAAVLVAALAVLTMLRGIGMNDMRHGLQHERHADVSFTVVYNAVQDWKNANVLRDLQLIPLPDAVPQTAV